MFKNVNFLLFAFLLLSTCLATHSLRSNFNNVNDYVASLIKMSDENSKNEDELIDLGYETDALNHSLMNSKKSRFGKDFVLDVMGTAEVTDKMIEIQRKRLEDEHALSEIKQEYSSLK